MEQKPIEEALAIDTTVPASAPTSPIPSRSPPLPLAIDEPVVVRRSGGALAWMLAMVIVLLVASWVVPRMVEEIQYALQRGSQRANHELAGEMLQTAGLSEISRGSQLVNLRISPSVVIINVSSAAADEGAHPLSGEELLPGFPHTPRAPDTLGQGSGIVVSSDGYILTNHHVVRDAKDIRVTLSDGRRLTATRAGVDPLTDLALLKVDANNLIPAEWGDSDKLQVGSLIWAVGSPFGLERSVSFGILSAKNRGGIAGTAHQDFLQTDAAVNPGNSGGPLVDAEGRVVGINTAIVGQTYSGVSFAIPSNIAREVAERLKDGGYVPRAWLGVELRPISDEQAQLLGLEAPRGALVVRVVDDGPSPAVAAGIQPGDVVLQWNGVDILEPAALSQLVAKTAIGSVAKVQVWRGGQTTALEVTVVERPRQY